MITKEDVMPALILLVLIIGILMGIATQHSENHLYIVTPMQNHTDRLNCYNVTHYSNGNNYTPIKC